MANTFRYIDSHVVTSISGVVWFPVNVTPLPGHLPTSLTATLDAPAPSLTQFTLHQVGGTGGGSTFANINIAAGAMTGTQGIAMTMAANATGFDIRITSSAHSPQPYTINSTMDVVFSDAAPSPACAYGAEPNPSAAIYTYITDVLVTAVAGALGLGTLGIIALSTMIGAPILFPTCSNVPSLPTPLTDADFIDGTPLPNPTTLPHWFQHFTYGVWLFYCRCKAQPVGQLPPVNPPVPTPPPRLAPGPQPPSPCSNADTCTTLNAIINILTSINLQINNQKYGGMEPAYTYGALNTGITGNGELAVSGILGVFVSFSTLPNRVGMVIGDPTEIFDVGTITFGSPDGWYPSLRITSNPWLSLPTHMSNISRVGYTIPPDVTCSIRLLVPVPQALAAAAGT